MIMKEDDDKVEEERNSPTTGSLPSTTPADTNYITILLIRRKTMIRSRKRGTQLYNWVSTVNHTS